MSRTVPQPPHFSVVLSELVESSARMTREWYDWVVRFASAVLFNTPLTGTVTFSAATTAAVTFTTAEATANYNVIVESPEDRRVWVTSKATTGFTLNVSSASSATYTWTVIRR